MQSPFSINTGSLGTGSSGTQGASAQTSQNSNGCPAFPSNCDASCASLDPNGCPICACANSKYNKIYKTLTDQPFLSDINY